MYIVYGSIVEWTLFGVFGRTAFYAVMDFLAEKSYQFAEIKWIDLNLNYN